MKSQLNLLPVWSQKNLSKRLKEGLITMATFLVAANAWSQSAIDRATDSSGLNWNNQGNWALTTDVSSDGEDSLVSALITHNQSSDLGLTIDGPATLRFKWSVSSELNGDVLAFYIDGELSQSITGEQGWTDYSIELGAGRWELIWSYSKDGDTSAGQDAGFIDQVEVIRAAPPQLPLGLVADTGFRPEKDGFSFPNYGNEIKPTNLTPDEMRRMFGDRVVARVDGSRVILTPPARKWMEKQSAGMDGGHCEGMAVLSALFHSKQVSLNPFGSANVPQLAQNNQTLQSEIAYWFVTQATSPAARGIIRGTPVQILDRLIAELKPGASDTYTIGVYAPPGVGGGHAVTPFAVENIDHNIFHVLVYDNNHPGKTRRLIIDRAQNRWELLLSINPGVEEKPWFGDANSQTLEIVPSAPRLLLQECTFCETSAMQPRMSLQEEIQMSEIYVDGNGVRLLITDNEGRRYGWDADVFVTEIPDITHRYIKSRELWEDLPSPVYYIPGNQEFRLRLDGSNLEEVTETAVTLIGNGFAIAVEDIYLENGEFDTLEFTPDGTGVSYTSDAGESPDITLGFETEGADFEFTVAGVETDPGATINIDLDKEGGDLIMTSDGNTENAFYSLAVVRYDEETEQEFYHDEIELEPRDTVYIHYGDWNGEKTNLQIELDWDEDGEIDETIELTDDENPDFFDSLPELNIEHNEAGGIRLSWENPDSGIALESSFNLIDGEWTPISEGVIEDADGNSSITIDPAGQNARFFRLVIIE